MRFNAMSLHGVISRPKDVPTFAEWHAICHGYRSFVDGLYTSANEERRDSRQQGL
jgi:hypothetical protein